MVKYWKGQHVICVTPKLIEEHLRLAIMFMMNTTLYALTLVTKTRPFLDATIWNEISSGLPSTRNLL